MPPADRPAAAAPTERQLHWLAVGLAVLAGFVDAVGFLQMGGIYLSFMSGNSTQLGVRVANLARPALLTGMIIAAFLAGVATGSILSLLSPVRRKPLVLLASSLGLVAGALLQMGGWKLSAVVAVAAAMGCVNTVFRAEDGPYNIGVTFMTGNLVKGTDGLVGVLAGHKRTWLPYLLLWLGLVIGAAGGAAAFRAIGLATLWIAAVCAALLTAAARNVRSPATIETPPAGR